MFGIDDERLLDEMLSSDEAQKCCDKLDKI